jgi:hypothetical protein
MACEISADRTKAQADRSRASRIPQLPTSSLHAFEGKLNDFKAENALLGRLLQDAQAHTTGLEHKLRVAQRKASDASRQQQDATRKLKTGQLLIFLQVFLQVSVEKLACMVSLVLPVASETSWITNSTVRSTAWMASPLKSARSHVRATCCVVEAELSARDQGIEKMRRAATTQIAALRRHKLREQQLEDALLAMKQDKEAGEAAVRDAREATKEARAKVADAVRRQRAAEAAEQAAQRDLANQADEVAAVRNDSRAAVARMQGESCEALRAVEAAATARVHELTAHVEALQDENAELQRQLACTAHCRSRSSSPQKQLQLASNDDVVADLRQRNHELQLALAERPITSGKLCAERDTQVCPLLPVTGTCDCVHVGMLSLPTPLVQTLTVDACAHGSAGSAPKQISPLTSADVHSAGSSKHGAGT